MMIDLPPPDPGLEVSVTSRGMSKGVAQTEGPQMVAKAYVGVGKLQLGGQWKNVSSPAADGEAAAFVNASFTLGGFQLGAGAAYKFQTGVRGRPDSDALELTGSLSRKIGPLGARLSMVYSPDDLGATGRSRYTEGGLVLDLGKKTRLSVNAGRREREGSPDYTSFNAGLTHTPFKGASLDLRYYDTDRSELGEIYHARIVVSARLAL